MTITIGILAIQGDVTENIRATRKALEESSIDGKVIPVKTPEEISKVDGIIIPGGESTTIGQLSLVNGALKILKEKIQSGIPTLGICAGMIMLSKTADDKIVGKTDQPLLDLLDIKLERNSFGRQKDSFESKISLDPLHISDYTGVFIRAPSISEVGKDVEVLSKLNQQIIAVKKDNILATAFHPELTNDSSLHKYFVNMIKN